MLYALGRAPDSTLQNDPRLYAFGRAKASTLLDGPQALRFTTSHIFYALVWATGNMLLYETTALHV